MSLYYLSFCAPMGWKGAAFIEADGVVQAQQVADAEGINPGECEVLAFQYTGLEDVPEVPPEMIGRRLGKEELVAFWPDAQDLMEFEDHV